MLNDYPCQVLENQDCGNLLKVLVLKPLISGFASLPGQFVMLDLPDERFFFRRPFSVLNVESDGMFSIFYKVVGAGTQMMADFPPGLIVNVLGPLGNSFNLQAATNSDLPVLLVGGGIGIAPMYCLGDQLLKGRLANTVCSAKQLHCFYGVRNESDFGLNRELNTLFGDQLYLSTDDGSAGVKGNVCNLLQQQAALVKNAAVACVCGPTPMMRAVSEVLWQLNPDIQIQVSLEEHMPCGTGACSGCVVFRTDDRLPSKVCLDGPVFDAGVIDWSGGKQKSVSRVDCASDCPAEVIS